MKNLALVHFFSLLRIQCWGGNDGKGEISIFSCRHFPRDAGQGCSTHQEFEQAALLQSDISKGIVWRCLIYQKCSCSFAVPTSHKLYFFIKLCHSPYKIICSWEGTPPNPPVSCLGVSGDPQRPPSCGFKRDFSQISHSYFNVANWGLVEHKAGRDFTPSPGEQTGLAASISFSSEGAELTKGINPSLCLCSWRHSPFFFFQTQNNKIWRSQWPRVSRNRWSSSCISVPNLCCSHRAAVMCLCCTPRFLIYTARKRAGDTFLHLLKGMRLADSLSPGFIFIGNPRQSRSWKSQSPKSSRSLQPSCQDWAALSWFHLLLTSLNVWPITECLRAPWGKLPTHHKNTETNPSTGKGEEEESF